MPVPLSLFLLMLLLCLLGGKVDTRLPVMVCVCAHKHNTTYHFTFIWKTWGPVVVTYVLLLLHTSLAKTATYRRHAMPPFPTSPATGKACSCLALSSFHIYHTRRSFPKAKAIPLSLLSPTFTTSIFHFFTTQFAQGVTQSSTHWLFTVNILPQINFSFVYLSLPLCLLLCYNCRDLYYNSTLFTIINTIKITVKTHFSVIFFNTHKRHSLSNVSPLHTHDVWRHNRNISTHTLHFMGCPFSSIYLLLQVEYFFVFLSDVPCQRPKPALLQHLLQLYILFIISSISKNII